MIKGLADFDVSYCPRCGSIAFGFYLDNPYGDPIFVHYVCTNCGYTFV